MFCWEDETDRSENFADAEIQTDIPLEFIKQFVLENRSTVISWLEPLPEMRVCLFGNDQEKEENQLCKAPNWLTEPLPPPASWNTQHHRFSAGDVIERSTEMVYHPLPSSRSLKFHPYS